MQDYQRIHSKVNINVPPIGVGVKKPKRVSGDSFNQLLRKKIGEKELKISKHAQKRMNTRNIRLSNNQKNILNDAVEKAERKGVKESLILMKDLAFVVSVKNKTVITAMDEASMKGNVFTNIDGAVIV